MKISLTSISIGERVEAAKTSPALTDTSSIPLSVDPSPGDSNVATPDTSSLDSVGANVNQQTQLGNKATSDSARRLNNPINQSTQYDKQTLSASDQAPAAEKTTDIAATPQPKTKGFKEALIDRQVASQMSYRTGGDRGSIDQDFGHNNGDPGETIKTPPEREPIRRDRIAPYDNSNNVVPQPSTYPITDYDTKNDMAPYKAPEQNLGPKWKAENITQPNIKFNTPKVNTPRFK